MAAAGILVLAFLAGSLPISNVVARRRRGVDLRDTPTGTVSGTALYRVAGFPALAFAGILDVTKGAVGPLLALDRPVLGAFAGGVAVAGHNWSPFLRGAGGRGIAPALGALLVNAWPGAPLLLACLVAGKAFGETGAGGLAGILLLAPVLAVTHGPHGALAGGAIAVPMLVKRVLADGRPPRRGWRPYARRLVLDNDGPVAPRP